MPIYNVGAGPPPSLAAFLPKIPFIPRNSTRALPGTGAFPRVCSLSRRDLRVRSRPELLRPLATSPHVQGARRRAAPKRATKKMGRAGEHSAQVFGRPWRSPRARWRLASSGVGVAAGGRRRGGSPRLVAQTADFFLRGRALDPAEAVQTVRFEPELEGDGAPARELAGAGQFPRASLHALQSLAQVSPLLCHEGKFSAGPGLTAGTLRVTPNDLGIVHKDTRLGLFKVAASRVRECFKSSKTISRPATARLAAVPSSTRATAISCIGFASRGTVRELFDTAFLPGVCAPMCIGVAAPEMRTLITLEGEGLSPAPVPAKEGTA
jgi:hypothetical protein